VPPAFGWVPLALRWGSVLSTANDSEHERWPDPDHFAAPQPRAPAGSVSALSAAADLLAGAPPIGHDAGRRSAPDAWRRAVAPWGAPGQPRRAGDLRLFL